jgi:repressor LexA
VKGTSMQDSGIFDGDIVIIRRQRIAENGQVVIALIDGKATLKEFYKHPDKGYIELKPHNVDMKTIVIGPDKSFEIYGVLAGLYRTF